jgi:cbb3-type cytochrome oxidase subunit 3
MEFLSDVMFWREATTVASFLVFLGIVVWAYIPKHKHEFNDVAYALLQDDDTPPATHEAAK